MIPSSQFSPSMQISYPYAIYGIKHKFHTQNLRSSFGYLENTETQKCTHLDLDISSVPH